MTPRARIGQAILAVMQHPVSILAGVASGFVVGLYASPIAELLKPAADAYVTLLSMCLLPILVLALISGVASLLRKEQTRALLPRLSVLFVFGLALPAGIAITVAELMTGGGPLSDQATNLLGNSIASHSTSTSDGSILGFFETIIPANIFDALSAGRFVSIVVFCVLTGLALGRLSQEGVDETLSVLDTLYKAFILLFGWVLSVLPIGLFCLVAANVAGVNTQMLHALVAFVASVWIGGIILLLIYVCLISLSTRHAPWVVVRALQGPIGLAFATDNPLVALYSAIDRLDASLDCDRELAESVVPFGVLANQHGQILLLTCATIFMAHIYDVALTVPTLLVIALASSMSGAAAVGGGAALAPVLAPLLFVAGVPAALGIVVLGTTQAIVAPLCSAVTVGATCTLTVMTQGRSADRKPGAAP